MSYWPKIYVSGVGMVTPLGDSRLTAAAIRAGISSYQQMENPDLASEIITLSIIPAPVLPALDDYFETEFDEQQSAGMGNLPGRAHRMLHSVLHALDDLKTSSVFPIDSAPLLLGIPDRPPGQPAFDGAQFLQTLLKLSKVPLNQHSEVFAWGRSSSLYATKQAAALIASKQHPLVLVGGVDSYMDMDVLEALDQEQRLLFPGALTGFVAGEGACILALIDGELLNNNPIEQKLIQVGPVGVSDEPGHRYSDKAYRGDGLAQAFKMAVESNIRPIPTVMTGFNGEDMMTKEWGVAVLRNQQAFIENLELMHPADCVGDLGAASGALQMGLATVGMTKNYIRSPCLIWSSSECGARAAACLCKSTEA